MRLGEAIQRIFQRRIGVVVVVVSRAVKTHLVEERAKQIEPLRAEMGCAVEDFDRRCGHFGSAPTVDILRPAP